MSEISPLPYKRALVVSNPIQEGTPHFRHAQQQIEYFEKAYNLPVEVVNTDRDRSVTAEKILQEITARTIVLSAGGDGTFNVVAESLLRQDEEKRPALIAVGAGSANDFAHNHFGGAAGEDAIVKLLTNGQKIEIHPLALTLGSPTKDGPTNLIAINNAGVHYTAQISELLNSAWNRNSAVRRLPLIGTTLQEAIIGLKTMNNLTDVAVYIDEGKEAVHLTDITLVHAHIAGKIGKYPVRHSDEDFLYIVTKEPTRRAVLATAIPSMVGRCEGERRTELSIRIGNVATIGHVDGETFSLVSDSTIDVRLSEESFKTYSLQK